MKKKEKRIASIRGNGVEFEIVLNDKSLIGVFSDGYREYIPYGDFNETPNDKQVAKRVFELYSTDGYEVVNCIGFEN